MAPLTRRGERRTPGRTLSWLCEVGMVPLWLLGLIGFSPRVFQGGQTTHPSVSLPTASAHMLTTSAVSTTATATLLHDPDYDSLED